LGPLEYALIRLSTTLTPNPLPFPKGEGSSSFVPSPSAKRGVARE
jgi:hypothetical protein